MDLQPRRGCWTTLKGCWPNLWDCFTIPSGCVATLRVVQQPQGIVTQSPGLVHQPFGLRSNPWGCWTNPMGCEATHWPGPTAPWAAVTTAPASGGRSPPQEEAGRLGRPGSYSSSAGAVLAAAAKRWRSHLFAAAARPGGQEPGAYWPLAPQRARGPLWPPCCCKAAAGPTRLPPAA